MSFRREDISIIDAYLRGSLNNVDKALFEKRLIEDSKLREEFTLYKQIKEVIYYGSKQELRIKTKQLHEEAKKLNVKRYIPRFKRITYYIIAVFLIVLIIALAIPYKNSKVDRLEAPTKKYDMNMNEADPEVDADEESEPSILDNDLEVMKLKKPVFFESDSAQIRELDERYKQFIDEKDTVGSKKEPEENILYK